MPRDASVIRNSIAIGHRQPRRTLRIAILADLHACWPFMTLDRVTHLVRQTNALEADVICLLGDYAGHVLGGKALKSDVVAGALSELTAPLGVYAVFGNHDWRDDPRAQAERRPTHWHGAFTDAGLTCLNNAVVRLPAPLGDVQVAGLDSQRAFYKKWKRNGGTAHDMAAVARDLNPTDPVILLAHEPDIFPALPDCIDLTLSGHTHGGQIAPFGQPIIVPSKFGRRFAYGHHSEGPKQLVVSAGLGYSGLPIRIGRPPEINLIAVSL